MGDIFGAISQYGPAVVIIGVIIYVIIMIVNARIESKKKAQEAAERLQREQLEAEEKRRAEEMRDKRETEMEAHFVEVVKELIQGPKHTVEEQRENRRINQFVVRQLDCLVKEGADRAYVFSFHNGGTDVLGRGFLKMSMTEEDVGTNIVPIMAKYQNMPRMLFPHLYEQLDEHDCYNVDDVETIKEDDPFTYQFLIEHCAKSAMFRAIKREDGLMVGFVGMEYIYNTCQDAKAAGRNIDKKANRIMGALLGQEITTGG